MSPFIQTYTGGRFQPLAPRAIDIHILDIAHALSQLCRFSGHTATFYSVAEHSVRVSEACAPKDALWGLLHDASEAYLVDLPSPLKRHPSFEGYRKAETLVMAAVCTRFFLPWDMPDSVHRADAALLATEVRDLMSPVKKNWRTLTEAPLEKRIVPWTPHEAKSRFLERFRALTVLP